MNAHTRCAWLLGLFGLAAGAVAADDEELQQLMGLLAQRTHAEARFQQSQYLAALTRPLQSAGTLSYEAPHHLEQRIDTPRRQLLVLDHGQLTMQLGRHHRTVSLTDYPELAPLLGGLAALLSGDLPALQQQFEVRLSGPLGHWELRLTPRAAALQGPARRGPALHEQLRDIQIRGQGIQINELQIEQLDGDHAVMHIEPAS